MVLKNYIEEDNKMPKLLSTEETNKIILEYIEDDRKNQAILFNGEWGCGKTYFINEKLIPQMNTEKYQIFQISLYGVSSIEKIQDIIYGKWIEKVVGDKSEKLGALGNVLTKGIGIFGKSAIQFIESKIGTNGSAADATKDIFTQNIGKNRKTIFIFDDIERCQINIIELMGFLNNLSENNGYKLILVANEQEINRGEDDIVTALKYGIALNSRLDIDNLMKPKDTIPSEKQDKNEIKINRNKLENITNYYFNRKSTYERTKEKLIGLTIPYSISIAESFDEIVAKYIKNESVRAIVQENKESIFELFEHGRHKNLRTLIVACIAIENIISSIYKMNISEKEILNDELTTIVRYTVYSAMKRTNGKSEHNWASNTRYGFLNDSLSTVQHTKIYGYAFVDEYWKTQCIDTEDICSDIKARIAEAVALKKSRKEIKEHQSLALNRLINWHLLLDDEVKQLVLQMKEELKQKKYYPQEFKDIILTLMRINNPNFGLKPDEFKEVSDSVFDSTESVQFVGMSVVNEEVTEHQYTDWEKIEISDFIDLMIAYFDDSQFELTINMIRVMSEEKQFVYDYRQLTMPLFERIKQNELLQISAEENGMLMSDRQWDIEFVNYCYNNKSQFINLGKFLSLFDYNKLTEQFIIASPIEINYFCNAVKKVYSFSNLADIFSVDYRIIKGLCDYISENIGSLLNGDRSRTKEIALRRLEFDMKGYENLLKKNKVN